MNITFLAGIFDTIKKWFTGWFGAILSFIPKIFYQLMTFIFAILDLLQYLVRKFAGLDNMAATAGAAKSVNASGDLALYMINLIFSGESAVLTTVFWSMIILGVFMLALTTFIAIIKSEYTATSAKDAAKGPILINALKGLASFVVVPITCFFGLYLGNLILQLVDKLTNVNVGSSEYVAAYYEEVSSGDGQKTYYNYSIFGINIPTTNTPISGIIFQAAAYNCNRARTNANGFYDKLRNSGTISVNDAFYQQKNDSEEAHEYNASLIDQAFANTYKLKSRHKLKRSPFQLDHMFPLNLSPTFWAAEQTFLGVGFQYFDKNNTMLVWYYYDLWSFDYITCIASLIVVTKLLIDLALGLIKRVFELTMLFLVAAPMASLRPLDNGNAAKQWTSSFVSKAIGVYGPIAGLNLFFIILSVLSSIKLTGFTIIDKFIQILFVIVGLVSVKDLTGMISKLIGGEDTLSTGSGISGAVAETAGKTAKATMAFGGAAGKLIGMTGGGMAMRAAGKGLGAVGNKIAQTDVGQAAIRKFNTIRSHVDKDFGDQRALEGYMRENGIDANDKEAVEKAKENVKNLNSSERRKYISSANKEIKNDAIREKFAKNARDAAQEKERQTFKNDITNSLSDPKNFKRLEQQAMNSFDLEQGAAGSYENLTDSAKVQLIQQQATKEALKKSWARQGNKGDFDQYFNSLSDADKREMLKDPTYKPESKEVDPAKERVINTRAAKYARDEYEKQHGIGSYDVLDDAAKESLVSYKMDKAKSDIKKEESTKKRTQTRNDIVLGDHAKDGIVAAIKDGFKALKDMAKDSTNGIAGGLVSNVAKPFKLDKDSIKEKTEKAKMESKEAEHGKAETTRHSEMMKAINELKSILNSNNKGTVKLDKDSAKDIAKAISDSLKNKK